MPRARPRTCADRRRCRLLPRRARKLDQAAGTAAPLRHAAAFRLSLRLRPVSGTHAARLPVADRTDRPLQPALPDLLRRLRTAPARLSRPGHDRAHARCGGEMRGRTRRGAAFRRRADPASAVLRGTRRGAASPDPAPDAEHQRPAHRARARVRAPACRISKRLRGVPAVRLAARGRAGDAARREAARHPPARARRARRPRPFHDLGGDGDARRQRRRARRDHRFRQVAPVRARRDLPAGAGGGSHRRLRRGPAPADADRSAPAHPGAVPGLQRPRTWCRCRAIPTAWRWPMR